MRAKTKGKHEIRKRFAIVIGVAATAVMALGAQTVTAGPPAPHRADIVPWHGGLGSEVRKCVEGRRVFLFEQRRGPDRKLGSDRNQLGGGPLGEFLNWVGGHLVVIGGVDADADPADPGWFTWGVEAPMGGRVYAKVMPKVRDGFVCRADRSRTVVNGRAWIPKNPGPPPSATGEPPAVVKYDSTLTITRN